MNISIQHIDHSDKAIIDVSQVGSRVKSSRQAAGYSVDDLAETCGLTTAEITRIEDGVDVDMQHIKRIAPALQMSVASLLEGRA